MEISQSNFNITDLNYGLVEGARSNVQQNSFEQPVPPNFLLNTSPIQPNLRFNKRKRKNNKRLNAFDNEYFNDFDFEQASDEQNGENINFFIPSGFDTLKNTFFATLKKLFEKIPVLNSYLLTKKSKRLKNTVKDLNEINQNVDDILNGVFPYGEDEAKYGNIAQNLVHASTIIGKVKKDIA